MPLIILHIINCETFIVKKDDLKDLPKKSTTISTKL